MGDIGEFWNDIRSYRQAKRRDNLEKSTEILRRSGVPFESKNNDVHLIVAGRWDYWPSTGLFIDRVTKKKGRGVHNLLKCIERDVIAKKCAAMRIRQLNWPMAL